MSLRILTFLLGLTLLASAQAGSGWFLCIGVSDVDDQAYEDLNLPNLKVCEADAASMATFAQGHGMTNIMKVTAGDDRPLSGRRATRKAVTDALLALADKAQPGDLVLISYSGHGGQAEDMNGDESGFDETWCLYDGQIMDDQLALYWVQFKAKVRILLVSDSCFSGTINKALLFTEQPGIISKALDPEAQQRLNEKYRREWSAVPSSARTMRSFRGSQLLLAASGEKEESYVLSGDTRSLFTKHFLKVVEEDTHTGSYNAFINEVTRRVKAAAGRLPQTPVMQKEGSGTRAFAKEKVCVP